jgi:hypothetical protein
VTRTRLHCSAALHLRARLPGDVARVQAIVNDRLAALAALAGAPTREPGLRSRAPARPLCAGARPSAQGRDCYDRGSAGVTTIASH